MATILKTKRNGESKDLPKEKSSTSNNNNNASASGNHGNEKELTYEEKLKEVLKRREQNNKKFFSWKDRKQAYLLFVDPDHGHFDTVPNTLDPKKKKIVKIENPDGTITEQEEWPLRDICDHRIREITYHSDEEVLGPEVIWRMPITAVEAFERFRKRRKFKLEVEKTGTGGQIRYNFYEIDREAFQEETEE